MLWLRRDWGSFCLGPWKQHFSLMGQAARLAPAQTRNFRVPERHPSCKRSLLSRDGRDLSVQTVIISSSVYKNTF